MDDIKEFQQDILLGIKNGYGKELAENTGLTGIPWKKGWDIWENAIPSLSNMTMKLFNNVQENPELYDTWLYWRDYAYGQVLLLLLHIPSALAPMFTSMDTVPDMKRFYLPDTERKKEYQEIISLINETQERLKRYRGGGDKRLLAGLFQDMIFFEGYNSANLFMGAMPEMHQQLKTIRDCFESALDGFNKRTPYHKKNKSKKSLAIEIGLTLTMLHKEFLGQPLYKTASYALNVMTYPENDFRIDEKTLRSKAAQLKK